MLGEVPVLPLVQDAALLASTAVLYDLVAADLTARARNVLVSGLVLGLLVVTALLGPHGVGAGPDEMAAGPDEMAAAVLMLMAGLFFGPVPTGIAFILGLVAWLAMSMQEADGVAVAVVGAALGVILNRRWSGRLGRIRARELVGVGVLLGLVGALHESSAESTFDRATVTAIGVMVALPLATMLTGMLLSHRVHRAELRRTLSVDEERLRLAMGGTGQGLFDYDLARGTGAVSSDFVELLEEDPTTFATDLAGGLARIHPDERPAVLATLERLRAGQTDELRIEYRARTRTGRDVWVRSVGRVVSRSDTGEPIRIVGTNKDITAVRTAELRARGIARENQHLLDEAVASRRALLSMVEDLRATQQTQQATLDRYMGLVENSPDAILVNRDDRFVLANGAALRLLGATDEAQILGRSPYEIFAEDAHPALRERIRSARSDGMSTPVREFKVIRFDGGVVEVDATASPFDDHGVTAIHVVLRDVTDRKRAEADLVALNAQLEERVRTRTGDLEDAYRELESFSYSVSHDLRAPLRAITGFSQILSRRHADQLDETGRHYLDNISTAGERMGMLIEDLLAYSRIGRRDVRHEPVDVEAITEAVMATLVPRIIETGASIGVERPLATPLGDPTLLQQVLLNLVGNGITYSRADVPPDVTVRSVRVGAHVEVTVQDNGIGIAPEHHERVFEVFARLHTEDEIPGTGIGLAIVRKAARLMDGEVDVRSEPGAGSSFRLRLLAAPAMDAQGMGDEA